MKLQLFYTKTVEEVFSNLWIAPWILFHKYYNNLKWYGYSSLFQQQMAAVHISATSIQ